MQIQIGQRNTGLKKAKTVVDINGIKGADIGMSPKEFRKGGLIQTFLVHQGNQPFGEIEGFRMNRSRRPKLVTKTTVNVSFRIDPLTIFIIGFCFMGLAVGILNENRMIQSQGFGDFRLKTGFQSRPICLINGSRIDNS